MRVTYVTFTHIHIFIYSSLPDVHTFIASLRDLHTRCLSFIFTCFMCCFFVFHVLFPFYIHMFAGDLGQDK